MQKGYKRQAKGMAVLRCFIGLFIVLIVVLLATFFIGLDYSDKLSPEASLRPYVAETPAPTELPALSGTVIPADSPAAGETATPEPTEAPTPTPSPSPTPSPVPTPEPTTTAAKVAITYCYRSEANGNRAMVLRGYGYLDDPSFDGSTVQTYLIINRDSVSARAMLKATNTAGISGVDHADAQCANASGADFEVVLNAAALPDDIYTLGLVLQYTVNGETKLDYIALPSTQSFTVLNTVFLGDVSVSE